MMLVLKKIISADEARTIQCRDSTLANKFNHFAINVKGFPRERTPFYFNKTQLNLNALVLSFLEFTPPNR